MEALWYMRRAIPLGALQDCAHGVPFDAPHELVQVRGRPRGEVLELLQDAGGLLHGEVVVARVDAVLQHLEGACEALGVLEARTHVVVFDSALQSPQFRGYASLQAI